MAKKGKTTTMEIIIAIGVVLFIFSMIGILNAPVSTEELIGETGELEITIEEAVEVETEEVEITIVNIVEEEIAVQEEAVNEVSGTKLSASTSSFNVQTI